MEPNGNHTVSANRTTVATSGKEELHHDDDAVIDLGSIDTQKLLMGGGTTRHTYENKLTSWEMESLTALCDTFLPSVDAPEGVVDESIAKFWKTPASATGTPEHLGGLISQRLLHHAFLVRFGLFVLSTWIGTFFLNGGRAVFSSNFPYVHRFSQLPLHKRQAIMRSWAHCWFFLYRLQYTGIKTLIMIAFFTQLDEKDENVSWKAIGYSGPDPGIPASTDGATKSTKRLPYLIPKDDPNYDQEEGNRPREELYGPLHRGLVNTADKTPDQVALNLRRMGFHATVRGKRKTTPRDPSLIIRCDAVIVGSGSGGGVVAGMLSNAGYKVLVIEKGSYCARTNLSLLEGPSLDQMYEGNGLLSTDDVSVVILAGSTVGGGSTINWSASLRTPQHVIREWSEDYELELFDSKLYREALDVVCQKMGVQSEIEDEGFNNAVLRKGCNELGYSVTNIPRNAPADHYCGWCSLGCKDGKKKGTPETWLKDMVDSGNGAILPGCEAKSVLRRRLRGRTRDTATGVLFEFNHKGGKDLCVVESKVTIVAGGALNTPILLRKSGLKNPSIGKNLHLHPVAMAWGHIPESSSLQESSCLAKDKKSYEGGIMTAMSTVVANVNTSGYGAIIQTPSLHPGLFAALMPWRSGVDMKVRMSKFSRTAHLIALARDKGSGTVTSIDKISYKIDPVDEANLKSGIEVMLRILAAAGAEEIGTHHLKGETINVKNVSCREFERFVREESSRAMGNNSIPLASAHQMGSCRMGVDPTSSVVNQTGETWEVEGLFLADGSVFPTALGVNPMVTIQAIAYCTGHSIIEVLRRKTAHVIEKN